MLHFDGKKDELRRKSAELLGVLDAGASGLYPLHRYVKTVPTYAVELPYAFEVETLEGLHTGKPGDFLAVGAHGEMYPIDAEVMKSTYREEATR